MDLGLLLLLVPQQRMKMLPLPSLCSLWKRRLPRKEVVEEEDRASCKRAERRLEGCDLPVEALVGGSSSMQFWLVVVDLSYEKKGSQGEGGFE